MLPFSIFSVVSISNQLFERFGLFLVEDSIVSLEMRMQALGALQVEI